MSLYPKAPDLIQLGNALSKPEAEKTLAIHFTPRSGSSRVTEILSQTNRLGRANELFNPHFMPEMATKFDAPDLEAYIAVARRRLRKGEVFSFEITAFQLEKIFGSTILFDTFFAGVPTIWLIREDIVLQAVSLTKMITLKMAHSTEPGFDPEARMAFDPDAIKRWLAHILKAEELTEAYFADYGVSPLRLSYEQTLAVTPLQLASVIAEHAGTTLESGTTFDLNHRKIGNDESQEFADAFRQRNPDFMARITAERASRLEQVKDLGLLARAER